MMRDTKVRVGVVGASVEFITVELRQVRCAEGSATRSPTEKSGKTCTGYAFKSKSNLQQDLLQIFLPIHRYWYIEKTDTKCKSVKITTN